LESLLSLLVFGNPEKGNRERITESTIFIGTMLNIFVIDIMEGSQKFIQQNKMYPLILTQLSKDQLVTYERKNAYLFYAFGAIFIIVGLIVASIR